MSRTPARRFGPIPPRQARGRRWLVAGLSLLAASLPGTLAACGGGGGGGGGTPSPDAPPVGLSGTILLEGQDLGRLLEQEPNDGGSRVHTLPPLAPRCALEVAGTLAHEDGALGGADPLDRFTFEVLRDQDVSLSLGWGDVGSPADLVLRVEEPSEGLLLAEASSGVAPRVTAFRADAGVRYALILEAREGLAFYTLRVQAAEPSTSLVQEASGPSDAEPSPALGEALAATAPDEVSPCATSHVLVALRPGRHGSEVARRFGLEVGRTLRDGILTLRLPEEASERRLERIRARCASLAADPDVAWAEPDWRVRPLGETDDTEIARQWNLRAIGAPAAWAVTRGEASVVVGIIDSGIVDHPDLTGRVAAGYDFVSDAAVAGDGDGRDDDPTDAGARELGSGRSQWHGTHVAGVIAAAADDGFGIAGVAPGCRVMPLRALGRGGGYVSDVADAMLYAAGLLETKDGHRLASPLPILNLSFGLDVDSAVLRTACERASDAGVLLVGAAGNTGQAVLYPAAYPCVVAVGAVDADLETQGYSSFGPEVELAAPGGRMARDSFLDGWPDGILSCALDDTYRLRREAHTYLQGTSQAAPHVAGVAALLLSVDPDLTAADLRRLLQAGALDRGAAGRDDAYGWGVVQAHASIRLLLAEMGTPWSAPPSLWMPTQAISFQGLDDRTELPIGNGGGGRLGLDGAEVFTDDGGPWLFAELVPDATGEAPASASALTVRIDRGVLRVPGRYGGGVRILGEGGATLASIRVVAYVAQGAYAGQNLSVLALDAETGAPQALDIASPTFGYRYAMPSLEPGSWKVKAGQNLDGDGFFCEVGDACGWYGGPTEADAQVVDLPAGASRPDVDVVLSK